MNAFTAKSISFAYEEEMVLQGVALKLPPQKVLGVMGSSGSGKTTLLKVLAGLLPLASGEILLDGIKMNGHNRSLVPGYAGIKLVAQDYALRQYVRAQENLYNQSAGVNEKQSQRQANALQRKLRLEKLEGKQSHQISGGQKQRLALGSALLTKPKVLLLDEPFSNLDYPLKEKLIGELENRWKSTYTLLVTHEPADVLRLCDELLVLKQGKVVQKGEVMHVFRNPVSKYVAELLGPVNQLSNALCVKLGLPLQNPARKKQLVRPGAVSISAQGVEAKVLKCTFNGKCFEYSCRPMSTKESIVVYSLERLTGEGQHVFLRAAIKP